MSDDKITTRLRPDVGRRLLGAALARRSPISRVLNEALDAALPSLREIGGALAATNPADVEERADDNHS